MTPYYDDGQCVIYHGDCREIIPGLGFTRFKPPLVLTDPPYGIGERTNRREAGRSTKLARANDFPPVYGDDGPFNPAHLLDFPRLVLFGANHYADRLPPSPSWLVWDKLAGMTGRRAVGFNDNGDAELAWTNLGGPVRLISHRWMGAFRDSERTEARVHPTQKPVALMAWIIANWTEVSDLVCDPYMGSGPVLRAAKNLGRRAIGIEIEERYCEVAVKRLQQEVLPLEGTA